MSKYRYKTGIDDFGYKVYLIQVKKFWIWWYYDFFYTRGAMMERAEQLKKEGHKIVE